MGLVLAVWVGWILVGVEVRWLSEPVLVLVTALVARVAKVFVRIVGQFK